MEIDMTVLDFKNSNDFGIITCLQNYPQRFHITKKCWGMWGHPIHCCHGNCVEGPHVILKQHNNNTSRLHVRSESEFAMVNLGLGFFLFLSPILKRHCSTDWKRCISFKAVIVLFVKYQSLFSLVSLLHREHLVTANEHN